MRVMILLLPRVRIQRLTRVKWGFVKKKEETPNWLTAANLTVLTVVALIECKLIFDGTHVQTNFLVACSTLLNHSVAYTELV
jgi:hypothetical protein